MNFKIEILQEENKFILMNLEKIHLNAFEEFTLEIGLIQIFVIF